MCSIDQPSFHRSPPRRMDGHAAHRVSLLTDFEDAEKKAEPINRKANDEADELDNDSTPGLDETSPDQAAEGRAEDNDAKDTATQAILSLIREALQNEILTLLASLAKDGATKVAAVEEESDLRG